MSLPLTKKLQTHDEIAILCWIIQSKSASRVIAGVLPIQRDVVGQVEETTLTQVSRPQLNADDSEDEENEEAQKKNVSKHRQSVKEQCDKDTHAWNRKKRSPYQKEPDGEVGYK